MTITAKIVADTVWPQKDGTRITTLQLRYPRFIHAEELTHRVLSTEPEIIEVYAPDGVMYDRNLSRNASSSRAIPVAKLLEDVIADPVYPIHWGKNQPGMQAKEEIYDKEAAIACWAEARENAIKSAARMNALGCHKQIVNRLLEPFSHINVVVTATEWDNFFELRDHEEAQPEIQALARAMKLAMEQHTPDVHHIHMPYVTLAVRHKDDWDDILKVSAARCARVSYMTHDGREPDWVEDLALSSKLLQSPIHFTPFEHQARWCGGHSLPGQKADWYANFHEWRSQRFCMERGFDF